MCEYSIGKLVVETYLRQPYSWFLNRHSADLGKTILSEVGIGQSKAIYRNNCQRNGSTLAYYFVIYS